MHFLKNLYIFFIVVALNLSFFSTAKVNAKAFKINDVEISKPFENNFDKNSVIDLGFKKAFFELINSLTKSSDAKKINQIKLNEIKSMIESFSIEEEKFIDQVYYVNIGVSFDKKKIFQYLNNKNIFPTQIIKETFLFMPIIIDENINELIIFSENQIYKNWKVFGKKSQSIEYLLPTEDLEDINLINSKINSIENYDFKEIIEKYFLKNSIISLIFKNNEDIKILSKISIDDKSILKNHSFKKIDFENKSELETLIKKLKEIYEDLWKEYNQINTSIKLPIFISVDNENLNTSLKFEKVLDELDLIYSYSIKKFDKKNIYYELIFNGTPDNFINIMNKKNYKFDTQKKIWKLK